MKADDLPHQKHPCANCPFRKDTLKGWLGREKMQRILSTDLFSCHKKTHLQCAGHMLVAREGNTYYRLLYALTDGETGLKGEDVVFGSASECVEHHGNE